MILKEFTSELDKLFSLRQAEDFDNVGLLCGNPERDVSTSKSYELILHKINFGFNSYYLMP